MRFYNEQHEFYVGIDLVGAFRWVRTSYTQERCSPASSTVMATFFFIET